MSDHLCPRCRKAMGLVGVKTATGKDGSEIERQYRCVHCWKHVTETTPRKDEKFQGEANL